MQKITNITPVVKYMPAYDNGNIKALTYDGMTINGNKTKVFAYLGYPEIRNNEKVPAIVLVHGGGGHAYYKWVHMWNELGYAAIAMDTTGYYPATVNGAGGEEGDNIKWIHGIKGNPNFADDDYVDAPDNDHMSSSENPLDTQWMYHAVADTILAHNILRSDNRIDNTKIGITGISWGGVITSLAIGYDTRYAFAIPIFGAGYMSHNTHSIAPCFQGEMTKKLWLAEDRFSNVTMPVFWFNWNKDVHFSKETTTRSYHDTVKNNPLTIISLKDGMNHSHHYGWIWKENFLYADSIVKGTVGFPRFLNQPCGRNINCELYIPDGVDIKAKIVCDDAYYPAVIENKKVTAVLDKTVTEYYVELVMTIDGYDYYSSSEHIIIA
jgi:Acetyl esterase (deacetylase)